MYELVPVRDTIPNLCTPTCSVREVPQTLDVPLSVHLSLIVIRSSTLLLFDTKILLHRKQ